MALHTIKLPAMFYEDHEGRELPSGDVLKRGKRLVTVQCDDETLDEIESDAKHYASMTAGESSNCDMDESYRGLVGSAKTTVKRIAQYRAECGAAK